MEKTTDIFSKKDRIITRRMALFFILFVILIVIATLYYTLISLAKIDGHSMQPTLQDKDLCLTCSYDLLKKDPERFDIVSIYVHDEYCEYIVKRIIGLPGETVQIDEGGNIYINGELLEEHYGLEPIKPDRIGRAINPVVLGDDEYFVMGDNRNNSDDSRFDSIGNVKREKIVRKYLIRITPLETMHTFDHDYYGYERSGKD